MKCLAAFRKKSSFHTWLYRITVNYCINHLRRDKAQHHVELESYHAIKAAEVFENMDSMEVQDELADAIHRLPEKQQTTVMLRASEGLPCKDIAKILGCSVGTVKANYFHAVKNLKRYMKSTIMAHAWRFPIMDVRRNRGLWQINKKTKVSSRNLVFLSSFFTMR